jgi:FlaA1/EpsC-like NDP-sugar epimerase
MRLLHTNVLALSRLAERLRPGTRLFSVSSDKAVRPASLMGASKAWMEIVLRSAAPRLVATSARFANVAFSSGSLLDGFINRLAARQPLAAPTDVRRHFMSEREAGQLCLLAAFSALAGEILVPRAEDLHPIPLTEIAELVLEQAGLRPIHCATEEEARTHPALTADDPREWPCFFTASRTSGEKEIEEFVGPDEKVDVERYKQVAVIRPRLGLDAGVSERCIKELEAMRGRPVWEKKEIVALLREVVPSLEHLERAVSLDDRM